LGLATNDEVFNHRLNKLQDDGKDPRSLEQRRTGPEPSQPNNKNPSNQTAPETTGLQLGDQPAVSRDISYNTTHDIGFAATHHIGDDSQAAHALKREDSRKEFLLHKYSVSEWSSMDLVIVVGNKRLVAQAGTGNVLLEYKDAAVVPPEARWRFEPVTGAGIGPSFKGDEVEVRIISVGVPGWALTCEEKPQAKAMIEQSNGSSEKQVFRYLNNGNILPGKTQDKFALWVSGQNHDIVQVVPRHVEVKRAKTVSYKNKKGVKRTKTKEVNVKFDMVRQLKWSVLPEHHHLVMLPRLLRTTHAHSPFFRIQGEDVRRMELEFGPEQRSHIAGQKLIAYSPLLPYILGAAEGDWQKDKFWALCQLLGCPLVDRSGTLDCPVKLKAVHPIPDRGEDPGPLPQLLRDRARQLLDQHIHADKNSSNASSSRSSGVNCRLQVLWSGGIDTTAVLCAFLQVASDDELQHLEVRYCKRSIEEYPYFAMEFLQKFPHIREIPGHVRDAFEDGPTVTGDPADMLMGTFLMGGAFRGRYVKGQANPLHFALNNPWKEVVPCWMQHRGLLGRSDHDVGDWLRWMEPFIQASPVPIVNTFDWMWWVTYCCKYQHDLLRVFYNRESVPDALRDNVINFFAPEQFHRWSFHHHHEKMPDKRVWASYKLPLKQFIADYTKDQEYLRVKSKVQSVRNSWGFELGITDRWEVIRFGRFSVSTRRMREKYDFDLDRFVEPKMAAARDARRALGGGEDILMGAGALAIGAGFLTLAAFQNAEIFNAGNVGTYEQAQQAAGQDGGGYVGTCGE
jgi:hypothetical protein